MDPIAAKPWRLAEVAYGYVKEHPYELAVLPLGATEPHNLHLPYGTDTFEAEHLSDEACRAAWERGARVVLLPAIPYGTETNQMAFPLAMNLNPSTLHLVIRDLVDSFQEHVSDFDLPVSLGASVRSVRVEGEGFTIYTDEGKNFRGHSVIIATGKRHRPLGVPGEKEFAGKGVAYCATCDAPFFAGKKVVVAGGGNSAFTTALELLKAGASVTMVNFTPGWQADGVLQQKAGQFKKLKRLDRRQVLELTGKQRLEKVRVKNLVDGKTSAIAADGIFIEVGLISNSDLVKDLVQLNQQGEVVVDCACRTSREGVFAAGDVTTVPYKQIVVSAGEGAKAALSAHAYLFERNLV